jgi:hypothetical protein
VKTLYFVRKRRINGSNLNLNSSILYIKDNGCQKIIKFQPYVFENDFWEQSDVSKVSLNRFSKVFKIQFVQIFIKLLFNKLYSIGFIEYFTSLYLIWQKCVLTWIKCLIYNIAHIIISIKELKYNYYSNL